MRFLGHRHGSKASGGGGAAALALSILAFLPQIFGEGINCNGDSLCNSGSTSIIKDMLDFAQTNIADDEAFRPKNEIICANLATRYDRHGRQGICAYWGYWGGGTGKAVKLALTQLMDHGCGVCGTVPKDFPEVNDVKNGFLTVNKVKNSCCPKEAGREMCLCPQGQMAG